MIKMSRTPKKKTEEYEGTIDFDRPYTFDAHKTTNGKCTYTVHNVAHKGELIEPSGEFYEKLCEAIVNYCVKNGVGNEVAPLESVN